MTINADGSLAALADSVTQWFQGTEKPRFTLARDSDKLELGKGIEPPIANLYILFSSRFLPAAVPSFVTGQPWIRNWDYELLINGSTENVLPAMGAGGIVLRCGPRLTQACWKHKRLSEERTTGCVSSPTHSSVQHVMKDQSLWPAGGLAQPLAEPHIQTNELRGFFIKTQISSLPKNKAQDVLLCPIDG